MKPMLEKLLKLNGLSTDKDEQKEKTENEIQELREENQALSDMIDALLTEVLPSLIGE